MGKHIQRMKDNWYVPLVVGLVAESINHPQKTTEVVIAGAAELLRVAEKVGDSVKSLGDVIEHGGKTHHLTYQSPRSREVDGPDI